MTNNAKHKVGQQLGVNPSNIFGTDGVRGKAGSELTQELIEEIGFWSGNVLPKSGPLVIGQDSRISSKMFAASLATGLKASGRDVFHIGLCPTPAVAYLIKSLDAAGGFMVSASHNPPEDNGIKIFSSNGSKISAKEQNLIASKLYSKRDNSNLGSTTASLGKEYEYQDLLTQYKNSLIASTKNQTLKGVSIVLDLCWGSATACGAEVFESLGADLTVIHGVPDGKKINVKCGSTHLGPLRKTVLEKRAQMGFAFDGDADRMIAIDGQGRVIDGDHILYLLGSHLQDIDQLPNQRLVATVMSNLGFEQAWKKRGGILERTPVGDQHVYAAMIENGAVLGGEQSGHILSIENGLCGDGLFSALKVATLCKERRSTLYEWRDQSFKAFPQKLVNLPIQNLIRLKNWKDCEPLSTALQKAEESMGDTGRILLRPSGTEPIIRLMVEAKDPNLVDSWTTHLADVVEEHLDAA